ncbi:TonB-dependent receptor [Paracrocinitomix mangrovi]|uniref:TonB-dependent receptor n=1 Tax=Paracrocinitomix mangrovi TaxID=2862509 RepID=UPI001C8D6749|nr:TonB-dependent receptor [Paracrocinitomix mangrovi]UKN01299.1 TonB-dependent receptor [Paracrocinitomix mangrovi]
MLRNLLTLTLLLAVSIVFGQEGTLRGVVKSDADGNGVPFAKVVVMGAEKFASTDVDGLYSIPKIPVGTYTVRITASQFTDFTKEITIIEGKITTLNVELETGKQLDVIEVVHEDKDRKIDPRTSVVKITPKDILRVPVTGGVSDIAGYFQTVPGVVSTGDQGGQVYVRGGTPIQNKILLDGMTIYNPFHSIGFFSVFETDLIKSADIYTGGFNAKYGGRISSIMDITYRDGNAKRFAGAVGISPFTSNLLLEGPISKANNISFVVSGKASLLEQTSKALYPYINQDENGVTQGLPFNFWDLYGKVTVQGNAANKISFFGFSFNDNVTYQAVSNLNWKSFGGGSNFIFVPENSELFMKGRLNFSSYDIALEEENLEPRTSGIFGGELAFDFTYYLARKTKLDYGFGFSYFRTEFQTFNEVNRKIEQNDNTIEAGAYVSYRYVSKSKRLILEPSFRFQAYSSVGQVTAEPRFAGKFNITDIWRVKVAGGFYTQNFTSTTSDQDVVNLFYGFITAPSNIPSDFQLQNSSEIQIKNGLQKAWHGVGGIEIDLSKTLKLNLEGYYKFFNQLTNVNRNKIYEDNAENSQIDDVFKKDFIIENGRAWGGDIVLTFKTKHLYIWTAYSLGKVVRWDGFDEYAPVFDRRHNVNLIATYTFGKNESWEITSRWNLGTGLPFKQTVGVYEQPVINNIDDDYVAGNANELTFIYENGNNGRLPTYHRLDLNVKKTLSFENNKNLKIEFIAGVTNVYSRNNIFYVNRVTNEKVHQLPIMPSLAVNFKF